MNARAVLAGLAAAAALLAGPAPARADHVPLPPPTPIDPATSCNTAAADFAACRAEGWMMRKRFHMDTTGRIRFLANVGPCTQYEGSGEGTRSPEGTRDCYWNHRAWGTGPGESYVDNGRGLFVLVVGYALAGCGCEDLYRHGPPLEALLPTCSTTKGTCPT